MKTQNLLLILVCSLPLVLSAGANDWPQWRGPNRTGIAEEKGLLKEWPEEGPKLLWQANDLNGGYSTPAIAGERLYLQTSEGVTDEFVQARKVEDGSLVWSTRIGAVGNPDQQPPYPGARSTPTVDGKLLYALGSDGDLACLQVSDGKIIWQKNVPMDFGGKPGDWAYAESPLIDGDVLVVTPGGETATLVALSKRNGEVIWKAVVPEGDAAGYASIITVTVDGVKQYVQFLANGLVGVDAKTGEFLWRYDETADGSSANIPTPISHENFVYNAAGETGGALVKLTAKDGHVEAESEYFQKKLPSAIGGAVKIGDYLYGTGSRNLMCVEFATGEVKWQAQSVGAGALCYVDGMLYLHGEENGDVALVEASPDEYIEKGVFTPPDIPDRGKSRAWAYPVVANGQLYVRDMNMLWCYDMHDPTHRNSSTCGLVGFPCGQLSGTTR